MVAGSDKTKPGQTHNAATSHYSETKVHVSNSSAQGIIHFVLSNARILREGQTRKIVSRFGLRLGLQFRRAPLPSGTVHWRAITRLG